MDRNRIEENFLTAMQTIAKAEVAAVKYDQTITCTIVDDSLRESGQYIVSDGTTRFPAYSSITSLRKDTVVYVTVPNGDFTQQKIIVGRQMEGEDKSFLYTAPFDNFIRCTPNLLTLDESTNKGNGYRLYANGSLIGDINNIDDICEEIKDKDGNSTGTKLKTTYSVVTERKDLVNYYKDFTRLGIRANFISWLKEYDITSGEYGLSFTISYQDGELEDSTNLSGQNNANGDFDIYKREENGFDINKEYYEKDSNSYKIVKDITKDSYKPNHYYYKNYVLDQDKVPRIRKPKDPSLTDSKDEYYTYYKKEEVKDQDTNTFIKYTFNKMMKLEDYEPGKYYYIPEEGLEEDLQYKLSTDNGFIPNCQYFVMINNIFEPILITSETYDPKKNLYGVKPLLKTKYKTLLLDTSQMLGNKYGFDNYYSQEMVFDISGLGTITEILLTFYENGHFISGQKDKTIGRDNNTDIEKSLIDKGVSESLFSSNVYNPGYETLVVNDIEVYMGYETQVIGEDSDGYLKLFCYESDKYKATSNPLLNMKNIYLKWAYKNEDGKIYIADKDNVGTFIEYLKDGISDFPEGENNTEEKLAYFERFALDASPTQVENRNYYERFVSDKKPTASGAVGNVYLKADYNFIPNQGNPYNSGRDYFEYGIFTSNDGVINAEGLVKSIQKIPVEGELVKQGIQYLKQTSTGDYLYVYPAVDTTISGNEWYKYDYASPKVSEIPTHYRGYKKVNIGANISQDKLYNYYYATYTNLSIVDQSDKNKTDTADSDYIYIYYLKADMSVMEYKPEYYYYYNCPNDLFEVRWYRYAQGKPAADEYSGIYWERIPTTDELKNSNMITHIVDDFQCELHPDYIYNEKESIKAIIRLVLGEETKIFYSEPIEFFNESPTIDLPSLEIETALAPKFDDGSLGNYYLYGENNSLIDMGDAQTQRSISLLFDVAGGASETRSLLKDADKVTWIFPLENTAIVPSLSLMQGIYTEKDGLGYFEDTEKRQEYKFYYTIEKYYSYTDGDNSIICNVIKDGVLYSTTANMSFGQSGSNGSEYTLVLDLMTADGMITLNPINNLYYKGLVKYVDEYPISEGQNIHPYPEKNKEPEGFYLKEELYITPIEYKNNQIYYEYNSEKEIYSKTEDMVNENNYRKYYIQQRTFNKINIDDYDWLAIGYDNLYVVREFNDTDNNRLEYPCLDEYLYWYDKDSGEELKSKVNINTNPREEEIKIVASLYDQNHKRMDISNYNVTWDWKAGKNQGLIISEIATKKDEIILLKNSKTSIDINEDMYIISATLSGLTGYDLQSYLCLPLRYDFGPVKYQGPTEILHNSLGVPLFYKDEMNLYYNNKEGQLSRYPYMSFELYNADATNGLGPKLNKLSSDVAEDIFISYDLTDTKQLVENIQYFQNPEIITEFQNISSDQEKAWSGYFKLVKTTDKQHYYEKIENNQTTTKDTSSIYDFTNLYSFQITNNESDIILCYNNCKISEDTFKIVSNQDTLIETAENTLTEKLLKKYASKYYLYEAKNEYFDSTIWNDKDQAYSKQENQIYKIISKSEYGNITDPKPQLYIPTDYKSIVYGQNQDINIPLFNINYQYILEETSDLNKDKTYYIPLNYEEDGAGEYYKWYEKKSISSVIFKENTYYSWDENNGFKLISSLADFQNLKDYCYVFFGYKLVKWTTDETAYKMDSNTKYSPDFSQYTLIENATEKKDNVNYFIKKEYYKLDNNIKNPGQVYYTPSSWEQETSTESLDWDKKVYFTQDAEIKYIPINEQKKEETTYYYKKKKIQKNKTGIDNYNFVKELRLISEKGTLTKNTSTSITIDFYKNNYFILDFSKCNPIKKDQVLTSDYCFVKTENKILNTKSSSSIAKGEGCFLQVPSIYIDGLQQFAIQLNYNNNTIFSIPVLYYLNRYFSSTINKWDGELTISGEKNTILAKMIGAGKKDEDNKFTGVIMGDWSNNNNSNLETGIYGFHDGATSFGFSANGQGFIGKAGHGRIIFDGDNAQLRSANYAGDWNGINGKNSGEFNYQSSGLLIDLDDAFLLATAKDKIRYIKIDAKTTGAYKYNGKIVYPEPSENPKPNRLETETQQYPFVVYGGENLYTEIGWNGDLKLKGSSASGGVGSISLDASGEIPFEIRSNSIIEEKENQKIYNRYVQINWDASIILSSYENGFNNKILLDASAPKLNSLLSQYHLTEEKTKWELASIDRPFQIGQYLRATWDGYLEAQGAFFKNSNANAFNVHYMLNDDSVSKEDNFFIGRGVAGTMGYIEGSNQNGYTNNVGLSSSKGHGIKLISETNLSISATNHSNTTKDENKTEEQIASISQRNEENQTTNTNQYVSTSVYISDVIYYFYDKEGTQRAYYKALEEDTKEYHNIYEITGESQFNEALNNSLLPEPKPTVLYYYQLSNQEGSISTPESETTADENKSSSTVGGIYIEAGRIFSSKIMNEKNSTVTSQILSDDGKMSNLVTNGFSILDLGDPKIDINSYGLLMNLSLEKTTTETVLSPRQWKLEYNNLNDTIFNTGTFCIQNSKSNIDEKQLLFQILEAKDAVAKSQTTIQTDVTVLPIVGNKLETNGGIKIVGSYGTEAYGLYNQNRTHLSGNVGIGGAPQDYKQLYVNGNSQFYGNGEFTSDLKVGGTTTTTNLTATGTIKLRVKTSDTDPTITVSSTGITFTGGAANQSGIYARFA